MNYNIKGTGVAVSDELRTYVERQLAHADKLLGADPSARADIELEYNQLRDGGKYRAEFTANSHGHSYRAECMGSSLHEAIDLAGARLTAELRANKKKRLHVLHRTGTRVKEYLRGWRNKM